MCGHIQRVTDNPLVQALLDSLGVILSRPLLSGNFYPGSLIDGVMIDVNHVIEAKDAIWWFLIDEFGKPIHQYATFNARHLDGKLWKGPIKHHRCAVIATGFGESIGEGTAKRSYLLQSKEPFLLGGVYREYQIEGRVVRGLSIITRDPHPNLSRYHDKACPLFLPPEKAFIRQWLDPLQLDLSPFSDILAHPKLYTEFQVTPVKSTKRLTAIGPAELLPRDDGTGKSHAQSN